MLSYPVGIDEVVFTCIDEELGKTVEKIESGIVFIKGKFDSFERQFKEKFDSFEKQVLNRGNDLRRRFCR